jgi:hypothetical protein
MLWEILIEHSVRVSVMSMLLSKVDPFICALDCLLEDKLLAGCWWLTPVILAPQEAEIRRTVVGSQPRQIVCKTLSQKNSSYQRAGGVAQGVGPGFKPQTAGGKKKRTRFLQTSPLSFLNYQFPLFSSFKSFLVLIQIDN